MIIVKIKKFNYDKLPDNHEARTGMLDKLKNLSITNTEGLLISNRHQRRMIQLSNGEELPERFFDYEVV